MNDLVFHGKPHISIGTKVAIETTGTSIFNFFLLNLAKIIPSIHEIHREVIFDAPPSFLMPKKLEAEAKIREEQLARDASDYESDFDEDEYEHNYGDEF